ncbi:olfactomedin-4-like [Hyla sarda]|uniref:olfactomedin-4-like n=1 Tax=Hyla sarda TaxID=327740 RepID=UPI0024C2636A|nr:olfactomedin-4-like [Hyla sarda]
MEDMKDTMFTFFFLLLGICQIHAASLLCYIVLSQQNKNFTGSLDELGVCHCSVVLPDSTFPADRFEMLEMSSHNLTITVEQQITKIHHYESTLIIYMERLVELTKRVEIMETGSVTYTELEFELVKLEIKEMEALILQLKSSMNSTNVEVETLYLQIRNISIMVNQLEVYDKNNVLVIKREIASLKKQLEDCEKNKTGDYPSFPPMGNGTYQRGLISSIGKPFIVQLNYYGASYRFGGWGRDSMAGADQNVQWVSPLHTDGRMMYYLRTYNTYNDLLTHKHALDRSISNTHYGQGGGMIMYNKIMYYNCYNNRNICKYNPQTNVLDFSLALPNAAYNNRFPYSSSTWQDIDMSSDEEGLWAIYSTEENAGNIVISKLDPLSLAVKQTWITSYYKPAVTNAFMAYGVLYLTKPLSTQKEEIFYMYDTKTEKVGWVNIPLEKPMENVQSLHYNPNDHKLYMYNDGYLVNYDITFKPAEEGKAHIKPYKSTPAKK